MCMQGLRTESSVSNVQTLKILDARPEANLVLAGDMNWKDARDGEPKLAPGW